MDVERYRRYKSLTRTSQNLRDHMSDLELALVTLGETVAVALHQARGSNSFEQLTADSIDSGVSGHPGGVANLTLELANRGRDGQNLNPSHPAQSVA